MNLYQVTRLDNGGYDSYDSFIVCCESEDVARKTHPSSTTWDDDYSHGWVKLSKIGNLEVEFLGTADPKIEEGVILASFNAG